MTSNDPRDRGVTSPTVSADLETQPTQITPSEQLISSKKPIYSRLGAEDRVFSPGTRIADRYRILEVLGVGGMGVVYRAHDEMLGVELALKILRPEIARDDDFVQRFRNELVLARRVSHRHAVSNYDVGIHEGLHFMTMDLVNGRTLEEILREKGKLPLEESIRLVRQVAGALAEAHRQGIVHRDLKPANIMLDADGDAYVTDFGIARSLGSGFTRTGEILGTPDYLSPEQARGEKVDGRSDIYTLGIIFIQILTGKLPFPGGTLLEVVAQRMAGKVQSFDELGLAAPPNIAKIIERSVEKDAEKRYQSLDELLLDLEDAGGSRKGLRSRRALIWGGGAALFALTCAAFFLGRDLFPATSGFDASGSLPRPSELAVPAGTAAIDLPSPEPRHAVAVLPFRAGGGGAQLAWASNGVAEMLATALAENEDLRVVESVRVFQILQDLGFEPGRLSQDELQRLTELLRVDRLVFGDLRSVEGEIRLEMSLMEADLPGSPSRQIATEGGDLRELFNLTDRLALRLRDALEVVGSAGQQAPLTPSATAMQAYTVGLAYLSRRETLKAAPELENAVREDPDFANAWVRLSQAYQSLGRFEEALDAARKAVRATQGARGRIVYESQAQEALLRGAPREAQRFLEELVQSYPNDTGARIALAEAFGQQGNFAEAVSRLEEVVEVDPGDARAWYLLGRFTIMSGEAEKAIDYLFEARDRQERLRNEQGAAEVMNALGVSYERLGNLEEAKKNYRAAADLSRQVDDKRALASTLINLTRLYISEGSHDRAEESIETAIKIHEELGNRAGIAEMYTAYGVLEEERGRYPEALDYYNQALKERTSLGDESALAESYGNVGYAYYILGEYLNALLHLERALDLYQANEDQRGAMVTLQSIGLCQLAQGKWDASLKSFVDSLEISREAQETLATSVSLGNLGLLSQYQGRYSAALDSYRDALLILAELGDSRGQVEFTLHEAEALLEVGDFTKAAMKLDQVEDWQANGGNREQRASLLTLRGHALIRQGEIRRAERLFQEAAAEAEASQSAVAQLQVRLGSGLAALEAGQPAKAARNLRPAVAEADRLGNAILQLRASEALARADLEDGKLESAEDLLRKALRRSDEGGSYGRAFQLHRLLADVLEQMGKTTASADSLERAREELDRVRRNLDDALLPSFDRLPEVRDLLAPAAGRS